MTLAHFLAQTDFNAFPHAALQAGKRGLLDCLGCALGGARSRAAALALDVIEDAGGNPQATLIATGKRAPLRDATLFNATRRTRSISTTHSARRPRLPVWPWPKGAAFPDASCCEVTCSVLKWRTE